jgi:hypothetical protein
MTGFRVRIVVQGRIGAAVRSALAGLDAEVIPRHNVIVVGTDGLSELLAVLESCNRRGVEVYQISGPARFVADPAHSRPLPEDGTPASPTPPTP